MSLLTLIERFGTDTGGRAAVHSGNMGDIIHALPAVRELGICRLVLNIVNDPPLGGRALSVGGARFLVPLLLAQPGISCVDLVHVPVGLAVGFGAEAEKPAVTGLPLEHVDPALLGVDYNFDRFRLQPLDRKHLVACHSDAVGASARGDAPWFELPARYTGPKSGLILSLTPRYRSHDSAFFAKLLEGLGPITKVGLPSEAWVYGDIPGDMLTAPDALALAETLDRAALFIGGQSLPHALAEGLKLPRLVDSPTDMLTSWPTGPNGLVLPDDLAQARALVKDMVARPDAASPHAWYAPRPSAPLDRTVMVGAYPAVRGADFREEDSQWLTLPRTPGAVIADLPLPSIESLGGPLAPPMAKLRLNVKAGNRAIIITGVRLIGASGGVAWSLDLTDPSVPEALADSAPGGLLLPPMVNDTGVLLLKADPHAWFTLPIPAAVLGQQAAGGRLIVEASLSDTDSAVATVARHFTGLREQVRSQTIRLDHLDREAAYNRSLLEAMRASTSWRVTAPIRALKERRIVPALKRRLRSIILRLPFGDKVLVLRAKLARRRPAAEPAQDLAQVKQAFRAEKQAEFEAFLASGQRLVLPRAEKPLVSIIIVLWNQAELSYACLKALVAETAIPVEIIIADNASSDKTGALLDRIDGAVIQRNTENLNFLLGVNRAAPLATGDHILLLNNDAVMRPGALRAALETLTSAPDIGAVGGRIVLLNGRLQEAGSLIWRDGSCLGYGRNLPPEAGEVMFQRDVDYCSGAFLLFRRDLFAEMGGFDERFAPAYYEETDFCLRLWQRGLRVVYDPRAVIDHFEFGSSEKSGQALALQQKNRLLFLEKHQEFLTRQFDPAETNILPARTRPTEPRTERVLVLDDRVPLPPLGAGFPRACHLLHAICDSGRLATFYPIDRPDETWEAIQQWLPATAEVILGGGRGGLADFLKSRKGFFDTVIVSRPHNMMLLRALLKDEPDLLGKARLVYDAEAVFAIREKHRARVLGLTDALKRADREIEAELALAGIAQRVVTVSPGEARHYTQRGYRDVHVLGHGLTPAPTPRPFADRHHLLFVGLLQHDESPNVDSLLWFGREIMPLLRPLLPDAVELQAVGRNGAPSLDSLAGSGVRLVGPVEDLTATYDRCRVFIAPTRFAGGIPHKIHEAAAHGIPVVATALLAEQLGWTPGEDLLTADTPEDFARQVAALYQDETLWTKLRTNALARLTVECDPAEFDRRVRAILTF